MMTLVMGAISSVYSEGVKNRYMQDRTRNVHTRRLEGAQLAASRWQIPMGVRVLVRDDQELPRGRP